MIFNTINSIMLIIYAMSVMAILLDFHLRSLTLKRQVIAVSAAAAILAGNALARLFLDSSLYGGLYLFLAQLPIYLAFSLVSRYRGIRLLFVLLSTVIFSAPPRICISALNIFCPASSPAVTTFVFFLCYVIMLALIFSLFRQSFHYMLAHSDTRYFWLFCLIPVLYYVYTFAVTKYDFGQTFSRNGFLIRQIPTLIVLTSYILLTYIFRITRENQRLENENSLTQMQIENAKLYLDKLKATQEQTLVYRHNMRHHLSVIGGLAAEGNLAKILEYLAESEADINSITPDRYCDNEIANLILSSLSHRARGKGVTLHLDIRLPRELSVSDTELCSLLSNALENAVSAAEKVTDKDLRTVSVCAAVRNNGLIISTRNHYNGIIKMEGELPVSEKPGTGHGLGIKSMISIVERHGGLYSIETDNGIFVLQLMLPLV